MCPTTCESYFEKEKPLTDRKLGKGITNEMLIKNIQFLKKNVIATKENYKTVTHWKKKTYGYFGKRKKGKTSSKYFPNTRKSVYNN